MPEQRRPPAKPGAGSKSSAAARPGQAPLPGEDPDNPGNVHGCGVDDHVFFHRDGKGPHAGRVVAHGVHGCTVEDDAKARHKVRWGRVLGLKQRAVHPMKVVDRGEGGAILEHGDGRRVFVGGSLPIPDEPSRLSDLGQLEDKARAPKPQRLSDLEDVARAGSKTMAKAHAHECDGPALCLTCRTHMAAAESVQKAMSPALADLAGVSDRLRAGRRGADMVKSLGAGTRPLPVLLLQRVDPGDGAV